MTKKNARNRNGTNGPVRMLEAELIALRRDLRATLRAYSARLEIHLAQTSAIVAAAKPAEELSREQLHTFRELTQLLRERKLRPDKGRRKDLRKIDSLIEELQTLSKSAR